MSRRSVVHIPPWGVWDRHDGRWLAQGLTEIDAANARLDMVAGHPYPWELEVVQEDRETGQPVDPMQDCTDCGGLGYCDGCGRDCLECDGEGVVEVA